MSGVGEHPAGVRERALERFEATWEDYGSPTAAEVDIAREMGVGKTTLVDWAREAGVWPTTRASRVLELQAEIRRLRAQLAARDAGEEGPSR